MAIRKDIKSLGLIRQQNMKIIWEWRSSSMYPYPEHCNEVSFTPPPIYIQKKEPSAAILKTINLLPALGIDP
jgi:hypothetical protein